VLIGRDDDGKLAPLEMTGEESARLGVEHPSTRFRQEYRGGVVVGDGVSDGVAEFEGVCGGVPEFDGVCDGERDDERVGVRVEEGENDGVGDGVGDEEVVGNGDVVDNKDTVGVGERESTDGARMRTLLLKSSAT
jgi:hypothetical protein